MKNIIEGLFKRIFRNPLSSLIGVVLIAFSMIGLIFKFITFDQFTIFIPTILCLFYVKDTIFDVNYKDEEKG